MGNYLDETLSRTEAAALLRTALGRASRKLRQHSGTELTPSQNAVIAAVDRHGGLTPSAIAEHERISRPTVSRIVAKLRARGLVTTQVDDNDGRSYVVAVSEDGAALRELRRGRKNAYLSRLLRHASDEDVQLLAAAARVLVDLIDEDDA